MFILTIVIVTSIISAYLVLFDESSGLVGFLGQLIHVPHRAAVDRKLGELAPLRPGRDVVAQVELESNS